MTKKIISPRTIVLWALALGWVGVLFILSGQTAVRSSELSGWFTGIVLRVFGFLNDTPVQLEPVLRKIAHFGIFAIEGFLLGMALRHSMKGRICAAPLALVACAAMAVANEWHQSFVAGRSCEARDMLIDTAGAALGIAAAWALQWLAGRINGKKNVIIS